MGSRCCSDADCAEIANQCGFVSSLLAYINPTRVPLDQRQWSQEQVRKMQLEALSALFQLVQYMPECFINSDGNRVVLLLLQETTSREVQRKCLHLLQVAVRMGPEFSEELGRCWGAVGVLIEIFTDGNVTMASRQLCISVLAGLCGQNNPDNCKEFRKKGGVEANREEVSYKPDETTDNHLFYTLCVVECIWSAVVGTKKNELRFLDAGGLFALLDVLEIAPLLLKRQIIGCLADLMQYRKAAKLFVQWNSQVTMKGALKILLELWQSEQEATQSTTPDGVIRDLDRPLNPPKLEMASCDGDLPARPGTSSSASSVASGKLRRAMNFSASAADGSSRALSKSMFPAGRPSCDGDVANPVTERQDCRAKIYSILKCVGFECQEALNIAERQQMELVKLYPQCVELETWICVQESLRSRGVKPVAADRKWLADSIQERKEQTAWVQRVQQDLADQRHQEEKASLERFYDDIRSRQQFRRLASASKEGQGRAGQADADDLDGFGEDNMSD